jgi:hypothetical protein
MAVCQRWKRVLLQISPIWDTLHISFGEGTAPLEHARTSSFLRRSATRPLYITLRWDDLAWIPISTC